MQTESVKDHDAICCDIVEAMSSIGSIPYQFINYATCYKGHGTTNYFVSAKPENVYAFAAKQLEEEIYCLPIQRTSTSLIVPSGHKEELQQQYRLEAAEKLMDQSASKVLDEIYNLSMPANNAAEGILYQLQKSLQGCFDNEILQMFEGILEYTFAAKKISAITYIGYKQWLTIIRKDFEDDRVIHDVHERNFTGFAYFRENGSIGYYFNAVESGALIKRKELQCKRIICSPFLKKRYCYGTMDELNKIGTDFRNTLHKRFSMQYMDLLQQIYDLPSLVNKEAFEWTYQEAAEEGKSLLKETLNYYGTLWHVW